MEFLAVAIAVLSAVVAFWAVLVARSQESDNRTAAVVVELFKEYRTDRLREARTFIYDSSAMPSPDQFRREGRDAIPAEQFALIRELMWYYDHLGVLVHHDLIPSEPVVGYLGGAVLDAWDRLQPLIEHERNVRTLGGSNDPDRWGVYFELLANVAAETSPLVARQASP